MPIELVVFDMAGTTVNDGDAVNRCFRGALGSAGFAVTPAQVDGVMGWAKPAAIGHLLEQCGVAGQALDEQVQGLHADFVARMIQHYRTADDVAEMPGARETFARLRAAGVRVALNTGFSRAIAQTILDRFGWMTLVDASVCSDEVARGRPASDMIRKLMQISGVTVSSHVANVGDTPVDLDEGRNAGCGRIIAVTFGTHSREQLTPHGPTDLIDSLAELPSLLDGSVAGM